MREPSYVISEDGTSLIRTDQGVISAPFRRAHDHSDQRLGSRLPGLSAGQVEPEYRGCDQEGA